MSIQLYVGNLAYDVTEQELTELFSAAGPPSRVRLPTDRETGKLRGFAFVEFGDRMQADEAIRRFDKTLFKGRPLAVNEARPREQGGGGRVGTPGRPDMLSPAEGAPRSGTPQRKFGPDALPRNKRKPENRGSKKEGRPSPVARQRSRGYSSGEVEPYEREEDLIPSWAREDLKDDDGD